MLKCNFNKVALHSPVNLLHIFRIPFPKNTSERRIVYCTHLFSSLGRHKLQN